MNNRDQMRECTTERLSKTNLPDVEKLHGAVYGKLPPNNLFSSKYDTGFTAVQHIGFIAYNDQHLPVAFYGVIPCFIRLDDKIILAAQSADTMTHPEYRNQGLFVELALLTYELCTTSGIRLVFGFPNQNSLPGFINKLAWQRTQNMDCFIIPCAVFSWRRFLGKFYIFKNWYAARQQRLLRKYLLPQHGIANSVFNDGYAGVYRDHHYLKYKTYANNQVIKISRSVLWVKVSSVFLIGDILLEHNDFDDMMLGLEQLVRRMGIKEIHFHSSPGTTLNNLFAANFKSINSFPVIFNDLAGDVPINNIKFTSADIDTF